MRVGNDYRCTLHCDAKEQFGKLQWQADTSMRVGITGQIACVKCDATPGHTLHVRHFRALIDTRSMMDLLFQDRENARRGRMTRSACADTRSCDADSVAIDVCHLLSDARDDE